MPADHFEVTGMDLTGQIGPGMSSGCRCFAPDCDAPGIHPRDVAGWGVFFCDLHDETTVREVTRILDLFHDQERLEEWLGELSEQERERLYAHPLLKEIDLLP